MGAERSPWYEIDTRPRTQIARIERSASTTRASCTTWIARKRLRGSRVRRRFGVTQKIMPLEVSLSKPRWRASDRKFLALGPHMSFVVYAA